MGTLLGLGEVDRQHRLRPVQGLHLGLLVDRQHDRTHRGIQVEPDDIGHLGLEVRIVRQLEAALTLRLQVVVPPHLRDEVMRHRNALCAREVLRHLATRPMTEPRLGRWRAPGQRNNPRANTVGHLRRPPRTREIRQPVDPEPLVSVQPLVHRRLRRARHLHKVPNREPVGPPQHYLCTSGNRTVVTILAGQRIKGRPLRYRQIHSRDYCIAGRLIKLRDTAAERRALDATPFSDGTQGCSVCHTPLPTAGDVARHYLVPDLRDKNLGECPTRWDD